MGRNPFWLFTTLAVGFCVLWGGTTLGDGDPTPPGTQQTSARPEPQNVLPSTETAGAEVLRELAKLRQQVGMNVLKGTLLDASPKETSAEFARGLRKVLGLVEEEPDRPPCDVDAGTLPEVAKTLRLQCVRLDCIAGELEELKQYDHADQLRDSARQLRLIARQLQP